MSIKNKVTGELSNITTYGANGRISDITLPGNVTAGANVNANALNVTSLSNLGDVGNLIITGGNTGQAIITDGAGNLTWGNAGSTIASIPAVYFVVANTGNAQTFSNVVLGSYTANTDMTVFYNGSLLPSEYYTLVGDVLTVNTTIFTGDTIDVITQFAGNVLNITSGYGDSNVTTLLSDGISSNVITSGNISGDYFIGDGSQLTGLPAGYANANVQDFLNNAEFTGDFIPNGNLTQSLGNATNQWKDLWLSGNTLYMTQVPIGLTAANILQVAGANVVTSDINGNISANSITLANNLSAGRFVFDGQTTEITTDNGQPIQINTRVDINDDLYVSGIANVTGDVITGADLNASGNVFATGNVNGSGMTITGNAIITGNANVQGTLTFNDITNITTSNLVIGLGNNQSGINVTGGGIVVGNTAEAQFTYDQPNQTWESNLGITATGDITGANIVTAGNVTANNSLATNITATANVNASNLNAALTINSRVDFITGNIANPALPKLRIVNDGTTSYIQTGNGAPGSTGNIVFTPYSSDTERVRINTTSGNVSATRFIGDGSQLTNLPPAATPTRIVNGTSSVNAALNGDVTVNIGGGTNIATFNNNALLVNGGVYDNRGQLLAAQVNSPIGGQVLGYNGSAWVNSTLKGGGPLASFPGNGTVSFTIPPGGTYTAWANFNIPNGIIVWNATITITNTNVPVIGSQMGWFYGLGGGTEALALTGLPGQIRGNFGGIISETNPGVNPSNVFTLGIINRTGAIQLGSWGYIRIS